MLRAVATFGLELGIAFQMVDDALDFSPAEKTGKPLGGDMREGKITPPLLLYAASLPEPEAAALKRSFRDSALGPAELEALCAAIHGRGYAQRARELADEHLVTAGAALALLPASEERAALEQALRAIQSRER
jgi:octaprenyl-diphosphate synthase